MNCPKCRDVEACEDCEMGLCEFCCPAEDCPRSYAYEEVKMKK